MHTFKQSEDQEKVLFPVAKGEHAIITTYAALLRRIFFD